MVVHAAATRQVNSVPVRRILLNRKLTFTLVVKEKDVIMSKYLIAVILFGHGLIVGAQSLGNFGGRPKVVATKTLHGCQTQ